MRLVLAVICTALLVMSTGCSQRRPDFFAGGQNSAAVPPSNVAGNTTGNTIATNNSLIQNGQQVAELNSQLTKIDADNRQLHAQIAELQQQLNLTNEEKRLLRQQMGDAANQMRSLQTAKNETDTRLRVMQASSRSGTGATIRANNSLAERVNAIRMTGVEVRMDGDVVRIDLPTDRLFVQGTYQLQSNGTSLLDQLANEIRRNYPRQLIGIEGHTDNVPIAGTVTTHHQIAATQSMTVFNYLSRNGYLPSRQMFTMAVGSNQPRFSNGDPAGRARNRRIEIVVYPEVFEGG